MSLTSRFTALFLSVLALVLVGFSTALYVSASIYLDRQLRDRLNAALAILAAAAEIHPDGVEWEPQERVLPLGQDSEPERLRWMVFDDQGRCVDHSRNLVTMDFTDMWIHHSSTARLVDRQGRICAWLSAASNPSQPSHPAQVPRQFVRRGPTRTTPRCSIPP